MHDRGLDARLYAVPFKGLEIMFQFCGQVHMPAKVQYVARVAYVARVSEAFWTLDSVQFNLLWTKVVHVTAACVDWDRHSVL